MKAVSLKILKEELTHQSPQELQALCLRLSKFKKENKELLTYLLFESSDEEAYIQNVQETLDVLFENINTKSYFYIRKSVRKILAVTKKHIKYSQKKETEVALLLYFCTKLKNLSPSIQKSPRLQNTLARQQLLLQKALATLHEDLQFEYREAVAALKD